MSSADHPATSAANSTDTALVPPAAPTRRSFLKSSTAAVVGTSLAALAIPAVHAQESSAVNVALIGCGGRGSMAAVNAMQADPNNRLTVMCDIFPDRLQDARRRLQTKLEQQFRVTDDSCFSGFDGYKQVMASDVDVVLLCTPPHFRPVQLKAAIDAGKHVFCEKPVAVDAPGVRSVLKTTEEAKAKSLAIVSGLCWRYHLGVRETVKRIQDGAIGDIIAVQENYLADTLWYRDRKPEWSEMENQIRNWLYYTWLSGDHNVEQHIHSLDKTMWLMGDKPPKSCVGMGGRQVRTEPKWGNIYDHHAVAYEWANGFRMFSFTRQMAGENVFKQTEDFVLGTKGQAKILDHSITGENTWSYPRDKKKSDPDMYDQEHTELFASIKAGKPINNGLYMSYSTLLAIMGRMATYTGQEITWDMAMNSKEDLTPAAYEWGDIKIPEVAMPGKTKFS